MYSIESKLIKASLHELCLLYTEKSFTTSYGHIIHATSYSSTGSVKVEKSSKGLIHANFKISKNGSYQIHLNKGTTLSVTVDVAPCQICQLKSMQQLDLANHISASPDDITGVATSPFSGFPSYDSAENASAPHTPTVRRV